MTSESTPPTKSKVKRYAAFAVTGLLTCVVGVGVGMYFSPSAAERSEENPSTTNETPDLPKTPDQHQPFGIAGESKQHATESPESQNLSGGKQVEADPKMAVFSAGPRPENAQSARHIHVSAADDDLRSGNFAQAERRYLAAAQGVEAGIMDASLRFRLALCAEVEGKFNSAQRQYRRLSAKYPTLKWHSAAQMGEARCLAALGNTHRLAGGILRHALIDQTICSERVRGELMHLAGRAFCQSFLPDGIEGVLSDKAMLMPKWITDPTRQLESLPTILKEEALPPGKIGFKVTQQVDQLPDSIYVRAHTLASKLDLLLKQVTTRSGFACDFSDAARVAMSGRSQQIHMDDIELSLLLDGLCTPFGMQWWHDSEGIHVRTTEEVDEATRERYQRDLGLRLLKTALVTAPDSRQSGYSRVAMGIMNFDDDKTVDAAYHFQLQMQTDPRSEVETEAALNLGKCRLAMGQYNDARKSFLVALDSASRHPNAKIGAYLFAGRIQLEDGQYRLAKSLLTRALSDAKDTDLEPAAALMLGCVFLMSGQPEGTSAVLMKRRESLENGNFRSASAFLSAFARFRAAILPNPKKHAANGLVGALSRFKPEQEFGAHWSFLYAQACDELGLTAQAAEAYRQTIKRLPAAPLRDRAMARLATQLRHGRNFEDATQLLSGVNADRDSKFGIQIAMQAAIVALDEGDTASALKQCRHILSKTDDEDLQRTALNTMGQAYQMNDNHRAAVYCFAGMLPIESTGVTDNKAGASANKSVAGEVQ